MPLPRRHLQVFANAPMLGDPDAPIPINEPPPKFYPAQALYVGPNPDGSRKMCQNCFLWKQSDQQCFIHDGDVIAMPDSICGYHVYGKPFPGGDGEDLKPENLDPVLPEFSGLTQVPGGTSCDTCTYFQPEGQMTGSCQALSDPEIPEAHPLVEPLGCCTRWEQKI